MTKQEEGRRPQRRRKGKAGNGFVDMLVKLIQNSNVELLSLMYRA